jgi:translin
MDDVYSRLVTVDYPDGVTGGLRRTTDALRAVLERTRGDLTAAIRQDQLMIALSQVEARLGTGE